MSKVIYLVPEDYGFITHRLDLASYISSKKHDVVVITRVRDDRNAIISNGFKLYELDNSKENRNRKLLSTILFLISVYKKEKPDLVHHYTIRMAILGTVAAKLVGNINIVNTITGLGSIFIFSTLKFKILQFFVSLLLKLTLGNTKISLQNSSDYKFFKKLGFNQDDLFKVFGSGVNTNVFFPKKKNNPIPIVLLPSRMLWVKGIGEFIEAIKILKSKGIVSEFLLAGDSDESNPASIPIDQLKTWETEGWIKWMGHVEDMPSLLDYSDIVCLPSYREGLPKTLLEAASAGIPIVTTDAPGCREVVDHDFNGFLVPQKNHIYIYEALRKLILDEELRLRMGSNGRKKIEKELSSEIVIRDTIAIYNSLVNDLQID